MNIKPTVLLWAIPGAIFWPIGFLAYYVWANLDVGWTWAAIFHGRSLGERRFFDPETSLTREDGK